MNATYQILERWSHGMRIEVDGKRHEIFFVRDGNAVCVWCDGTIYRMQPGAAGSAHAENAPVSGEIRAPMPGKILRIDGVLNGMVSEHETVVVMESMKMETDIAATKSGCVTQILVQPGQIVDMNELLVIIE